MKNNKIIYIGILFLFFIIIGTLSVNAAQEINTMEDLVFLFGNKNVETNENEIKLLNDINLRDNLIIKSGNYIIDMNGKCISYTKDYDVAFYMTGGNVTIKDETNDGIIIAKEAAFFCHGGFLKIENCTFSKTIYINNEAKVQIDNGYFYGIDISAGTLIINGGSFREGLDVSFEPFTYARPTVIINDGEFYGAHAGLYIWFSNYAENVQLKGGTFKGMDEETPGIFVGGDKFNLNNLLPVGYRFDNDQQNVEEQYEGEEIVCYHTTSANEVSVEKYLDRNIIKLIFIDYEGNVVETKDVREGSIFDLPEAPEKEGYVFVGWDIDTKNVTQDMVVTPIYEKIYNFEIDVIYDEYYTGEEIEPNITVIDEITRKRVSEEDYEIVCENNINAGTVYFTVKGKGKYKHATYQEGSFEIEPRNINYNCKAQYQSEFEYTGEEIKPELDFYFNDIKLVNGKDYEISYESNVDVGMGKIIISAIGNFTGKKEERFRIYERNVDEIIIKQINFTYTGNEITPEVILKSGNKELIKDIDYTVGYHNNIDVGTGTIIVNGKNNYSVYEVINFKILPKNMDNLNVIVDLSNKQYTGGDIKPSVKLMDGDRVLRENFDYLVQYSNNYKIGKATIKITGRDGYSGTIIKTFDIVPKSIKIKSIKSPIIRTVKLTWQKDSLVDGYEIYRSTSKDETYSLVKTIANKNDGDHTFLAHKKGTFYFTMRSYKVVNGTKIYSDFCEVSQIKVK